MGQGSPQPTQRNEVMSATPDQTRLQRIEELGKTLLKVSVALEAEDWAELDRTASGAARQARILLLHDRLAAKEEKWRSGAD